MALSRVRSLILTPSLHSLPSLASQWAFAKHYKQHKESMADIQAEYASQNKKPPTPPDMYDFEEERRLLMQMKNDYGFGDMQRIFKRGYPFPQIFYKGKFTNIASLSVLIIMEVK